MNVNTKSLINLKPGTNKKDAVRVKRIYAHWGHEQIRCGVGKGKLED